MKAFVYAVDGVVARIRAVDPAGAWIPDERGYMEAPLSDALGAVQAARRFPTLPLCSWATLAPTSAARSANTCPCEGQLRRARRP